MEAVEISLPPAMAILTRALKISGTTHSSTPMSILIDKTKLGRTGSASSILIVPSSRSAGTNPVLDITDRSKTARKQTISSKFSSAITRACSPTPAKAPRISDPNASFQRCSCHSFQRRLRIGRLLSSDHVGFEYFVEIEIDRFVGNALPRQRRARRLRVFDHDRDLPPAPRNVEQARQPARHRLGSRGKDQAFDVFAQRFGLRLPDDPAPVQNGHCIRDRLDFIQQMRAKEDRHPLPL